LPGLVAGQFSSPPAPSAAGDRRTALDIQTHRNRGNVPAARCQAFEVRSLRDLLVYVKRLRIELNRECLDQRLVDRVCRTGKAPTDIQIVVQEQPTGGVRPNARQNGQIRPSGVIWRILAYVVGFPCGLAANQEAGA
jgi:hypothetical protein